MVKFPQAILAIKYENRRKICDVKEYLTENLSGFLNSIVLKLISS